MTRIVRWILRLFPARFRDRYGDELADLLAQQARETRRRHGWPGVARMCAFQALDLVRAAVSERRARPAARAARERHDDDGPRHGADRPSLAPGPGVADATPRAQTSRRAPMIDPLVEELRHALRGFRRTPGLTIVALLTLALGIGATTSIFSVVHGILLQPLSYPSPDELVAVYHGTANNPRGRTPHLPATYFTYREESRAFAAFGVWNDGEPTVTGRGDPERVEAVNVTAEVFRVLQVPPALGRAFGPEEMTPGPPATVILGHGYWQRLFGGDPDILGRNLTVAGLSLEVIGVMPEGFRFLDKQPSLYLPLALERPDSPGVLSFDYFGVARLNPGTTLAEAAADVERMLPLSIDRYGWVNPRWLEEAGVVGHVLPLRDEIVGDAGDVLWVVLGAVGLVLMVACANVANLLLVRAEGRRRELAVRAALGASRWRVARQALAESLLLGLGGGALGLWLARGGIHLLQRLAPADLPRLAEVGLHAPVLGFALALSLAAGTVFGLLPLAGPTTRDPVKALKEGGRSGAEGRERVRARDLLVVAEVSLALVLLIGSGLMVRSFVALRDVDPGFRDPGEVLTFRLLLPRSSFPGDDLVVAGYREILDGVASVPGVASVGAISGLSMERRTNKNALFAEDSPRSDATLPVGYKAVAGDYFGTVGIPLVAGRTISWDDILQRRRVGLVTENVARHFWDDPAAALGQRIRHRPEDPWREIVGVVGDVRDRSLREPPEHLVYWPLDVEDFWGIDRWARRNMALVVRSAAGDPRGLLQPVQQAVWDVDPDLALADARTLDAVVGATMARTSFTLVMLLLAAGVGLVLGTVGIYGVVSYVFARRGRELGIRMALGATGGEINRLVLRRGGTLAAAGAALGIVAGVALTRVLAAQLYGVTAVDPATFAGGTALVMGVALFACWVPARRAAAVDPVESLRDE